MQEINTYSFLCKIFSKCRDLFVVSLCSRFETQKQKMSHALISKCTFMFNCIQAAGGNLIGVFFNTELSV